MENPRAESTRKSTKVERAKYPVRLRYSRDFRVPGGEDSALESASDVPLLDKMLPTLSKLEYTKVVVAGYTDNVPISAKLKAGAGLDISGNGAQCHEVTLVQGFARVTVKGSGNSVAAGVLTGDFLLRLPLDDFWLSVHLAPYFFAGLGGIFIGNGGEGHSVSQTFTVTNAAGESRDVTFTGRRVNSLRKEKIGYSPTSAVDSNIGSLPISGFLAKIAYVFPNLSNNNFIQTNFGFRFAF